jgi:hypothetical protein
MDSFKTLRDNKFHNSFLRSSNQKKRFFLKQVFLEGEQKEKTSSDIIGDHLKRLEYPIIPLTWDSFKRRSNKILLFYQIEKEIHKHSFSINQLEKDTI